ncbi:hypothetical protein BKA70DRAFT_1293277 [Coprinopsis sp. MPI-PUGE-AT-0042]|nr:hypothetical protein BKA70DRAFT_1293277 [Coprinopsis sp. MPI-PUGE-AT-0042]
MHRCLYIQEILFNIFEILHHTSAKSFDSDSDWSPARTHTLTALARTCKTFNDPAIKIVWRDLPGLYPISYLMEESMYVIEGDFDIRLKVKALAGKFIERLELYAPLVKTINVFNGYQNTVFHPSALLVLNSSPAIPKPLFPNLKRVELNCYAEDPMEALLYPAVVLGSSKLTQVTVFTDDQMRLDDSGHLTTTSDNTQWEAFTNRLLPFTQQLQKFSLTILRIESPGRLAAPPLTRLCSAFSSSMVVLDVASLELPYEAVAAISSLPRLEELDISVDNQQFSTSVPLADAPLVFPALRVLRVTPMSITAGGFFFLNIKAGQLEVVDIRIGFWTVGPRVDLSPLLEALGLWSPNKTLAEINILSSSRGALSNMNSHLTISDATLQSLALFPNLKKFNAFPCIHQLSDKGLIAAFADLKHLQLFSVRGDDDCMVQEEPKISLAGVQRAIEHCPQLAHLALTCDFREIPPSLEIQPHRGLLYWRVDCSPITCGRSFSEWARVHLPELRRVEFFTKLRKRIETDFDASWASTRQSMVYLDQWTDVPKLLKSRT